MSTESDIVISGMRICAALLFMALVSPNPTHFETQTLADDLAGGYQVVACDVNGDGRQDLIAVASNMTDLIWFENPT